MLRWAYPVWFDEPGCRPDNLNQRRCRARDSVRTVLLALIEDMGLAS